MSTFSVIFATDKRDDDTFYNAILGYNQAGYGYNAWYGGGLGETSCCGAATLTGPSAVPGDAMLVFIKAYGTNVVHVETKAPWVNHYTTKQGWADQECSVINTRHKGVFSVSYTAIDQYNWLFILTPIDEEATQKWRRE